MENYDNSMSRHSPQTIISKSNVDQLQVKWILNTGARLEAPPLIVGELVTSRTTLCESSPLT